MDKAMNRQKIIDFIKSKEDDLDSPVYDYILGLLDDESGEVTDADIITALKKNNIDKLQGYNAVFGDDALSDAPTNISSDEYDGYAKMRRPTESSKRKYGQRKIDEKLQKTKDEIEQRKKDVEAYETIGFGNPFTDAVRNNNVTDELADYDVKSKVDEYIELGLSKEEALSKVREDIKNIAKRKPDLFEKLKGALFGLAKYISVPSMLNDYYIETGKWDDAEARLRAGLGTGLNTVDLTPYGKTVTAPAKAAIIAAKPVVESVRKNITDTDDEKYAQAAKDALTGIGVNFLLNLPAEAANILKQTAGLGPAVEKLPPVKAFFEGMEESAKIGKDFEKEHRDAVHALLKKMNIDPLILLSDPANYTKNLANGLKAFARKTNNAVKVKEIVKDLRRLGYDSEARFILDIQTKPERDVVADFAHFKLGARFDKSYDPTFVINNRQLMASFEDLFPSVKSEIKDVQYPNLLDRSAEQLSLETLNHPKIAKAASKGFISSGAKAARNILNEEDYSYSEAEPYIENIKNDDLALRMWQAGFRPKNLTKRQIEYIDEEINR